VTRTVGIPWLGPQAGVVEPLGAVDVVTGLCEVATVVVLVQLLRLAPLEAIAAPSLAEKRS